MYDIHDGVMMSIIYNTQKHINYAYYACMCTNMLWQIDELPGDWSVNSLSNIHFF